MKSKVGIFFIIHFLLIFNLLAQDSTQTVPSGIKITASVASKEIPLNRPLIFTIQVEWFGDLNRYEISEVEQPVVKNFQIKSNASSDRREVVNGQLKAIKTFDFELIPQEFGMGYIEGVIVKYIDTETGDGKHLITNRLDVKVIEPIPEPGSYRGIFKWIILAGCLIMLSIVFYVWQRKKTEEKRRQAAEAAIVPIEKDYLKELNNSIPLDSPDINLNTSFSQVSLLLRKYLAEKYDFSATQTISEEIIDTLKHNNVSDRLTNNIKEVLDISDVVKFSGGDGSRADLERIYTLVEDIFNEGLKQAELGNAGKSE